jgi:catechol 1,2-dioxygenase
MKRREFTRLTGLSIIAISTSGFIRFNGESYTGDCETSSDILGPFYRPDSPVRNNLVIKDLRGETVELSGIVRHKDCKSPLKDAKVEVWHCSADQIYDNDSKEFRYRGTTFCDANGQYKFITQMPVPYDAGGGNYRPAHFHLMFSAPQYQSLITQIYFEGDPHIKNDPSASNPQAKKRILKIDENNKIPRIIFDCNMNERLKVTDASLKKLAGRYRNKNTREEREFFGRNGDLWVKNEVFGKVFEYKGGNDFEYGGLPDDMYERLQFEIKPDGKVFLKKITSYGKGRETVSNFEKL